MVKKSVIVGLLLLLCTACVSRLARPAIYGTVADYSGRPLAGCTIAEATTDSLGRFYLKEKRYHEFTAPGMEAPPLHFGADVRKEGYRPSRLRSFSKYGGGNRKGAEWRLDTIFLRKENEAIKLSEILYRSCWELSATKHFDTLYCVADTGYFNSIVEEEQVFHESFDRFRNGGYSYHKTGNLPDSIGCRSYFISPSVSGTFTVQRLVRYCIRERPDNARQKPNDTLNLSGALKINGEQLTLQSGMSELNGSYQAQPLNRKQMLLVRSASPNRN